MAGVTELKGLGNIRTALSTRLHAKPAQKGTAHRDLYILGNEKKRLEKEVTRLERQQKRVREHLAEVCQAIEGLEKEAQLEGSSQMGSIDLAGGKKEPAPASQYSQRQWKKMTFEY